MWPQIRTYIVVTLVTLLIWAWAEAETRRTVADRGSGVEHEVAELPLYVSLPAGRAERALPRQTVLRKVSINVTQEVKDRIEQGEIVPFGIITVNVGDLNQDLIPCTVQLGPPGIAGRMADPAPSVIVRIERQPR